MPSFYRIRDWQDIYENNRTRGWKNIQWVPIPINLSGDGYCMIMETKDGKKRKDGPEIFGTFIAIIELAAKCFPRGDLLKSDNEPHTFESIGRICRITPNIIEKTILFCVDPLKWIQSIDLTTNCDVSAVTCRATAECNSILCSSIPSNSIQEGDVGGGEKQKYSKRSLIFVAPTLDEVTHYFLDNGFPEALAKRFFEGYSTANWHDSKGKKIQIWKQKAQQVWFRPEDRIGNKARFGRQEVDPAVLKAQAARFMEAHDGAQ